MEFKCLHSRNSVHTLWSNIKKKVLLRLILMGILSRCIVDSCTSAKGPFCHFWWQCISFCILLDRITVNGLTRYLLSDDNLLMMPNRVEIYQDMTQPLSHYFVNSSHNTYLVGESWLCKLFNIYFVIEPFIFRSALLWIWKLSENEHYLKTLMW